MAVHLSKESRAPVALGVLDGQDFGDKLPEYDVTVTRS